LLECDENSFDPCESPDLCNRPKDTEKSEGTQCYALYAKSEKANVLCDCYEQNEEIELVE